MASAIVRSSLRSALRGSARANPASKRFFSSGASADEEAREAAKWEKITYAGIAACTVLAFVNLSKGHPHFDEPPPYPYLHIRNKEFPWALVVELVQVQMASLKSRNTIEARRSDLTAGTAIMSFS